MLLENSERPRFSPFFFILWLGKVSDIFRLPDVFIFVFFASEDPWKKLSHLAEWLSSQLYRAISKTKDSVIDFPTLVLEL